MPRPSDSWPRGSFNILPPERNPLLFYSQRRILYYSTPREESFTILLPERNPLLFYSQRRILYYSTPREGLVGGGHGRLEEEHDLLWWDEKAALGQRLVRRRRGGEREGPRLRVTTVRFGAPCPQAAGCLVRLQLPPSPSTRARGGQRPPPLGEGYEKIRDDTQGGKKVLVIAARAQSREKVRRAPRSMVPQCTTLCAALGGTVPTTPSRVRCRRTRSAGAWAMGSPRGVTPWGVRRTTRGRGYAAGPRKRALAVPRGGAGAAQVVPRRPTHWWGAEVARVAAAPLHRAQASAGCGLWGRPLAQAASWPSGPESGRVSSGRGPSWVWRASPPAEPRAAGLPDAPGPLPLALGLI